MTVWAQYFQIKFEILQFMTKQKQNTKINKRVRKAVQKAVSRRTRAPMRNRAMQKQKNKYIAPMCLTPTFSDLLLKPDLSGMDECRFPDDMPIQTSVLPAYYTGTYTVAGQSSYAIRFVVNPWCNYVMAYETGTSTTNLDLSQAFNTQSGISPTTPTAFTNNILTYADNYRVTACAVRITYTSSLINASGMMCIGTSFGKETTQTGVDQLKYRSKSMCAGLYNRAITVPHGYEDVLFVGSNNNILTNYYNQTNIVFYANGVPAGASFQVDIWATYEYTPNTTYYRIVPQRTHGYQNPFKERMQLFRSVDMNPGLVTQDGNSPYYKSAIYGRQTSGVAKGSPMVNLAKMSASTTSHRMNPQQASENNQQELGDIIMKPDKVNFQDDLSDLDSNNHTYWQMLTGAASDVKEYVADAAGHTVGVVSQSLLDGAKYATQSMAASAMDAFFYHGTKYLVDKAHSTIYRTRQVQPRAVRSVLHDEN